jgi:DNA-binding MarR family transcriptional regulator
MEPTATKKAEQRGASAAEDRELALRLGTLMMCTMGSDGGGAIRAIDESGLSFVQMKALVTVAGDDDGEPSAINFVAERLGISLPSASRAVDGLVKKGLVTRIEDISDRRVRRVSLTPDGREVSDRLIAARLEGLESFVADLNPAERRKLDAALELLLERPEIAKTYELQARRASK